MHHFRGDHSPRPSLTPERRKAAEHELGLLFDGAQFRKIGGWEYIGIVPLGGGEPALRRRIGKSVAAMRAGRTRTAPATVVAGVAAGLHGPHPGLRERRLAVLSDAALDAHVADALKLLADGLDVHFRLHGALGMVLGELAFTCQELLGWDETRMFTLLDGTSTTSPNQLGHSPISPPGQPTGSRAAQARSPGQPRRCSPTRSSAAFATYLRDYGCRTLSRTSLANRRWRSGRMVLALVRDQLDSRVDAETQQELDRQRDAAANEAREILAGVDLVRFERALERALMAYPVREDNGFYT